LFCETVIPAGTRKASINGRSCHCFVEQEDQNLDCVIGDMVSSISKAAMMDRLKEGSGTYRIAQSGGLAIPRCRESPRR